jgi:hypothetical protein
MRYEPHPIQWLSILSTISSVESMLFKDRATIADADADAGADSSTETLKCAWLFPAGSTQPISGHLKHRSPPLRLGGQYRYCSPMHAWPLQTNIVVSGRLGRYNGQTCLHLYYLHDLLPDDAADFLRRTAKYKSTVLDGPWNPAPPDVLDVSPLYEETFIRLLGHPTVEEIAHTHSTFVLAISLRTNLPFPA